MNQTSLEVLFSPAEFEALGRRDLSQVVCVVFDILRATSSIVTALGNGAAAILPVLEIADALAVRRDRPHALLAGERHGLRIQSELTGGIAFYLGNSPREFTPDIVRAKEIVMTTTNGTRALRACTGARAILIGSLLNLRATADFLEKEAAPHLLLVCGGTFEQAAFEDILGAGALCDSLWPRYGEAAADSAVIARRLFQLESKDLFTAVASSRNGRRLQARPELAEDVSFCVQRDIFSFCASMGRDGWVRRLI